MKVLFVCSEAVPWAKTGGLADVCGALPDALRAQGADVRMVMPLYRTVREKLDAQGVVLEPGPTVDHPLGQGIFWKHGGTWFLDCADLYDRAGIYGPKVGDGYGENSGYDDGLQRFAFFCHAVADHAHALCDGAPDVLHVHDWQAALLPLLLDTPSVITVHNLAYQGAWPGSWRHQAGDAPIGQGPVINLLAEGLASADLITTVSPTYAHEVTTARHGVGLDMLLRARGVVGVLNGVDVDAWSPTDNPHTAASYGPGDLAGKAACKAALRQEMGLPEADGPVFGVVSRLVPEKGLVEVVHAAAAMVQEGAQLVVLGTGAGFLEDAFARLAADHPHAIAAHIGFDVPLAHRIIAGSDAFLMPSRFEPCGLNQLYSQRYGTLPVVTPVGGLRDTVLDGQTGFVTPTPELLVDTVRRVVATWRDQPDAWRAMVDRGMALDLSWGPSATRYLELYRSLQG